MEIKRSRCEDRVCLACGKIHNGKVCPLIEKKLNRYTSFRKKNFLIGNILLKCIEKDVDFVQILLEIAEKNEERYEQFEGYNTILPVDEFIEYFAVSLGCSSREFFKDSQRTIVEYSKLIHFFGSPFLGCDENGMVNSINLPFKICGYDIVEAETYNIYNVDNYSFTLSKRKYGDNNWIYNLYLSIPNPITQEHSDGYQNEAYPEGRVYNFSCLDFAAPSDFLLASDDTGIFEKIFENALNECWTDKNLIQKVPLDDSRCEIWINKLFTATSQRLLHWTKFKDDQYIRYYTYYEQIKIILQINMNFRDKSEAPETVDELLFGIRCKALEKYSSIKLYVRNREGGLGICFKDLYDNEDEVQYDGRIVTLARVIDLYMIDKENGKFFSDLRRKDIEYSDVIITMNSMVGHDHHIEPLRGIVQLLTNQNKQIEYEIYVGYCLNCNRYYCFKDDYQEMIKHGIPLCAIYSEDGDRDKKAVNAFRYKSQSVLNARGYSVGMELDLSEEERQEILSTVLKSELVEVHDLISFLNWLIQTRRTQPKYANAVNKWQNDLKFVKDFERENRKKVNVEGIVVRK